MHLRIGSARVRRDAPWLLAAWRAEVIRCMDALDYTPRQRQVVWQLFTGRDDAEMARALGISYWTLKCHLSVMRQRAGVQTTRHLMVRLLGLEDIPCDD